MKNLVIVESPTKAKTISKFLGKDYIIKYSMGHIMDLPKSKLGVSLDDNFAPQYEVIADKKKLIAELKAAAKTVDVILLATDPDREGEAIASNIAEVLGGGSEWGVVSGNPKISKKNSMKKSHKPRATSNKLFKRIVFHEITESAIKEAIEHPRELDVHLVNAQIARRVLDRLVGYQLSPVLWKKVRRGLSAGRVQSVALRLIVEREREIGKFVKMSYWTIHAVLIRNPDVISTKEKSRESVQTPTGSLISNRDDKMEVEFSLLEIDGERIEVSEKFILYDGEYKVSKTVIDIDERAEKILHDLKGQAFIVADVAQRQIRRSPTAPFTTSTLQQEASRRYGFSGKRTMSLAQKLYEEGFITYHRTDSVTLSQMAVTQIRAYVGKEFGEKYLAGSPRVYSAKQKLAQEAHEAIRPTQMNGIQSLKFKIQSDLGSDYWKLYEIIWRRAVASQMADAIIESTSVLVDSIVHSTGFPPSLKLRRTSTVQGSDKGTVYRFKATGSVLVFDGFLKLNPQALQDTQLPQFAVGDILDPKQIRKDPHETLPPPRYNDASIISTLEDKGIGRPSTYASIISTLVDRTYVERIEKKFIPTPIGTAVNDFLVTNFSTIDDIPFTVSMEDDLDEVANGKKEWVQMMHDFYTPFEKKILEVAGSARVKIETEATEQKCPLCGNDLVIRHGKFGKFFSCSTFPACRFTKQYVEETDQICPKDGGKIIVKKTKKGRKFFGCSNYPACTFAAWKLEQVNNVSSSSSLKEIIV